MRRTWEFKYSFLLSFLVLVLVLYPYLEEEGLSRILLIGLFIAILFSAVYAAGRDRKHILIGLTLLLPGLVGHFLGGGEISGFWGGNPQFFSLPLYVFVIWTLLSDLLTQQTVSSDTLCGAASVYILTGIAWVPLYIAVENGYPGSFNLTPDAVSDLGKNWDDLLYFSFTTLTTLGYGDIAPQSAQARSLANLEAINGVLYIAVLVSKLVGMNIEYRRE
jgi:hypothetical protein